MPNQVMTVDGDRVDLICWRHYGLLDDRVVERVLEANPGISMTAELAAGTIIDLPDILPSQREHSLW